MALMQCNFFSEVLGLSTSMNVILPQNTTRQVGMKEQGGGKAYPVLYLLHGLSDDHTIWLRRTSIERYVAEYGLAVIMPQVDRSFYTDMVFGNRYWTFISEELPVIAQSFFPLSKDREDTFVAGLSMGGYGAFKLAMRHPERFSASASLSGAMDIANKRVKRDLGDLYQNVFGTDEDHFDPQNDLFYLADQLDKRLKNERDLCSPLFYQCCGIQDFLYKDNQKFRDFCKDLSLKLTYEEEPGIHEWAYWDTKIQRVLEWLPIRKV